MKKILLILPLIFLLASCGVSKKAHTSSKADKGNAELISAYNNSIHPYRWLKGRGKFTYTGNGQEFSASGSLKFREDSLIWGNVNYLIEVARGIITKDSAVLLNRANREYSIYSIKDLQNILAISGLNLKAIQRIFMACAPFGIDKKYQLLKRESAYQLDYQNPMYLEQIILDASTLRMKEYRFKLNESQKIRITYEDFNKTNEMFLPKKLILK